MYPSRINTMIELHHQSQTEIHPQNRLWIFSGVAALAISGLLSIVVVLLRVTNPSLLPENIFDISLIVHVNLSVLIWPLSMIFAWSKPGFISTCACYMIFLSTILIAGSSFVPDSEAIKNNYVPVLDNLIFFIGIGALTASVMLASINTFITLKSANKEQTTLIMIVLIAIINFILSYQKNIDLDIHKHQFYENLFWGGGHVLQFAFTGAMISAYARLSNVHIPFKCYVLNFLLVIPTTFVYYFYQDNADIALFFTHHMKVTGGLFAVSVLLITAINGTLMKLINNPFNICSTILFIYGGILGFYTCINSTTIPAHYHGSIIAVSVSLMGCAYKALSTPIKRQKLQIYIYTAGQLMHITGLAWMGGYGALRKTAGMILPASAKFAKIIFMAGGLITLIGGIAFIVIMAMQFIKNKSGSSNKIDIEQDESKIL